MSEGFEAATAVELVESSGAVRTFRAAVHDGWDIGGNANGGYVLAIAGRAMTAAVGRPPLSVTGHYLAPVPAGPCEIAVTTIRDGRRLATCSATLTQQGRPLLHVIGTFGEPVDSPLRHMDGAPPALPPYEACVSRADVVAAQGVELPAMGLTDRLAVRLRPEDMGFATGAPSGRAEIAGWFAFVREEPIDEVGLLFVADAMAPPVFNLGTTGWVPTVELTVHVRMRPAPGPLRCIFRTRFVEGGTLDEDGEIWDSAGNLVAQSRQLALAPRT